MGFSQSLPNVGVIVLSWNGKRWLGPCLESLRHTEYPAFSVLVIDNASVDGSAEFVRETFPETKVLSLTRNYGFAEGNNIGIRHLLSKGLQYIVLLNQDTVVHPSWLSELVHAARMNPEVGIWNPMVFDYEGSELDAAFRSRAFENTDFERDFQQGNLCSVYFLSDAVGSALMLHRQVIETVGFFDPTYFAYYEETDLCRRAISSGFQVGLCTHSKVHHWRSTAHPEKMTLQTGFLRLRNEFVYLLKDPEFTLAQNLQRYVTATVEKRYMHLGHLACLTTALAIHLTLFWKMPCILRHHSRDRGIVRQARHRVLNSSKNNRYSAPTSQRTQSASTSGTKSPEISVIIATYNRKRLLLRALNGLAEQRYDMARYEVIVADDGSTDATAQAVQDFAQAIPMHLHYVRNAQNLGPSATRNRGLGLAQGSIIAFIDDDFVPSQAWLYEISQSLKNNEVGGVSGRARSVCGRTIISRYCHYCGLHETPGMEGGKVLYLLGANMAVSRHVLDLIGGFDEGFVPAFRGITSGGEDTELSIRIRQAGYTLAFNERADGDHYQKNSLKAFLKESLNFGCSRVRWYQREGRSLSLRVTCWRILRLTASALFWPRHILKFRKAGAGLVDSLVFPIIEKTSLVCYQAGVLIGLLAQHRKSMR